MLILFQIIRKLSEVEIDNKAIFKIAELIAYAMGINLFLLGAEVFKEFYSGSIHSAPIEYLYFGLHGHNKLVPWTWFATVMNITAFFLFLFPRTRENFTTLNMACLFVIIGVYIEKGMGLIIPGFIPDTLGEIYEYTPTMQEILITVGIWATGALLYTFLLKFAIPVYTGKLRFFSRAQMIAARDIMSRRVATVRPETPVDELAKFMLSKHLTDTAVVDSCNKLIGTVSERDIISLEVGQSTGKTACDLMTAPTGTVPEDFRIQELGKVLASNKTNLLFVVNDSGQPIGTIAGNDILKALENIRQE
jgi:molybdopterin-containing oxidoreductase family membrane subunit